MVHRDGLGGTLILDIRLGKFGRFKAASGTTDVQLFRDVAGVLRQLRRARRWDVLALLVNKHIAPLELYDAVIHGRTDELPSADDLRPLGRTVEAWLASLDRHETTRDQYRWRMLGFGEASAPLARVPQLLAEARTAALRSGHRANFNNVRSAVRTMLRWAVGERHALFLAATDVASLRVKHRAGNPFTVDEVRALAGRLGELGPMAWALALSGMRRNEYFGLRGASYELRADRVLVHGTKSEASERIVPLSFPIAAPSCTYDHFRDRLTALTNGQHILHDFRYTFTRWGEDAGIPDARLRWYLGHAVKGGDTTGLYRRGRGFLEYLGADAERLRVFVGELPRRALEVAR